jgi:hypothetical protein
MLIVPFLRRHEPFSLLHNRHFIHTTFSGTQARLLARHSLQLRHRIQHPSHLMISSLLMFHPKPANRRLHPKTDTYNRGTKDKD